MLNKVCALVTLLVLAAATTLQLAYGNPIIDYFSFGSTDPYGSGTVAGKLKFSQTGENVSAEAVYILDRPLDSSDSYASTTNILHLTMSVFANSFNVDSSAHVIGSNFAISSRRQFSRLELCGLQERV